MSPLFLQSITAFFATLIALVVLAKLIEDGVVKITGTNEDASMKFSRWGKI